MICFGGGKQQQTTTMQNHLSKQDDMQNSLCRGPDLTLPAPAARQPPPGRRRRKRVSGSAIRSISAARPPPVPRPSPARSPSLDGRAATDVTTQGVPAWGFRGSSPQRSEPSRDAPLTSAGGRTDLLRLRLRASAGGLGAGGAKRESRTPRGAPLGRQRALESAPLERSKARTLSSKRRSHARRPRHARVAPARGLALASRPPHARASPQTTRTSPLRHPRGHTPMAAGCIKDDGRQLPMA